MRVLWLGNSDDVGPAVEEGQRMHKLVEAQLSEAIGEPTEVIAKAIWPAPELPEIISGWIERYEPDVVCFRVNWVWYGYESVPLRIQRGLGPVGRRFADAGFRAADMPWFAHNRAFRWVRKRAGRVIRGATYFTFEETFDCVESCLRTILRYEDVGVMLRGNDNQGYHRGDNAAEHRRVTARWTRGHAGLRDICDRLHVRFAAQEQLDYEYDIDASTIGDGMHLNVEGHAARVPYEAAEILATYREVHSNTQETASPS